MKKFIIIGSMNAITYKEIFLLIKDNKMWLGFTSPKGFEQPETDEVKQMAGLTRWFTNLRHHKRMNDELNLQRYTEGKYPKYDNYDAINVNKVIDIPDYDGVIGVPITFLDSYNPNQFEIVGMCENEDLYGLKTRKYTNEECKDAYFKKFGKNGVYDLNAAGVLLKNGLRQKAYARILIRKIK